MKIFRVAAFLLLLICTRGFPQEYQSRHIEVEDGLPSSEIYHCYQDQSGFIWFATNMGVSKFDGDEFRNFDLQDGLPDNTIFEIYEDSKNRIWFISFSLRLSYYKNGKIHSYKFNEKLQNFLNGSYLYNKKSFAVDSADNLYLGINQKGVLKIDSAGHIDRLNNGSEKSEIFIFQKNNNNITSIPDHIYNKIKLSSEKNTFSYEYHIDKGKWQNNIFVIKLNSEDWLMSHEGHLIRFNSKGIQEKHNLNKRVIWLSNDEYGNIWVGTFNGVLRYKENNLEQPFEHLLKEYAISSVMIDHEKGCWFSTLNHGLFYMPSLTFKTLNKNTGLRNSSINQITHDKDKNIWIADNANNITKLNTKNQILDIFNFQESINPKNISSLDYNPINNEIWVSNGYTIQRNKFIKSSESYKAVEFISRNKVYAAGSTGFYILENGKIIFFSWDMNPTYRLTAVKETKYGLFLGGLKGLFKFSDNKLIPLDTIDKRFNYRITTIKQYEDFLLLGTRGAGILIYNPASGDVRQITVNEKLTSNNIAEILIHGHFIFVATNNGLSRIEVLNLDKNFYSIDNFSVYSGLPSKEINDLDIVDSTLYLATSKGLTYSKLHKIKINKTPPRIHIKNISISGRDTTLKNHYILPHNKNFLTINYTGLSFKKKGELSYRYKMVGLDKQWKETTKTEKMFTTLPPGKYTFVVLVQNENSIWSEETAKIQFTIKKPFWKTWRFIILASVVVIIILYLIFHFRFKLVRRKKQLIQDINNYKQIVLRQQMNPHFLFNTLNSIQYYLLDNDVQSSLDYLSKFAKLMRMILDNSQYTHISINDELNALKLYLELEEIRLDNNFTYKVDVGPGVDLEENKIPALLLQPYVENAIHHGLRYIGNSDGKLEIKIYRNNKDLVFVIEDNGIGRKRAEEMKKEKYSIKKPLGSKITAERIKTLNSLYHEKIKIRYEDIKDESGTSGGTRVIINISQHDDETI